MLPYETAPLVNSADSAIDLIEMATSTSISSSNQLDRKSSRDVVVNAIRDQLKKEEFSKQESMRTTRAKQIGEQLISLSDNHHFLKFSHDMINALSSCFKTVTRCRSTATKRDRLWRAYHETATEEVPSMWVQLCSNLNIVEKDPLLIQSVARLIFEDLLKEYFGCSEINVPGPRTVDAGSEFTKDELNALRYACGYVAHKLLKKYEKRKSEKSDQFEMCLGQMAVAGDSTDFTLYTSQWLDLVNRGGLFPLNDESFRCFCAVETVVRKTLPSLYRSGSTQTIKQTVIDAVKSNDDVIFYWNLIAQDIDEEEQSLELLVEIVDLWVTVRGFSLASHWLEVYKTATKTLTKKSTGLRKGLS